MNATGLHTSCEAAGTALEGRIFTSLGFQPQVGDAAATPAWG